MDGLTCLKIDFWHAFDLHLHVSPMLAMFSIHGNCRWHEQWHNLFCWKTVDQPRSVTFLVTVALPVTFGTSGASSEVNVLYPIIHAEIRHIRIRRERRTLSYIRAGRARATKKKVQLSLCLSATILATFCGQALLCSLGPVDQVRAQNRVKAEVQASTETIQWLLHLRKRGCRDFEPAQAMAQKVCLKRQSVKHVSDISVTHMERDRNAQHPMSVCGGFQKGAASSWS